jgi:DNA mismatch repair protein MutS
MVDVGDMVALISEQLADDLPVSAGGGGVFRAGVHQDLDEMREISRGGKDWIANLEKTERARTNISTLKVRFNRAFGYFIEVSNAHRGSVPDDYVRKQTLVNAERYITPELKEYETKVLGAEEHISELEQDLFVALTEQLAARATDVARLAGAVATADVLTGLAEIAETYGYTRPTVTADDSTTIIGGRHPVVEQLVQDRSFVPNDVHVDGEDAQILVITGPNMAGKSTILRQVGLIVLMAHIGSFVPAKEATVALTDRIFTRVGAQDNLAGGESTFLVEMHETANILHNCTDRSLVLFDEVGRGTSTFDGLSIAWAIVEFLHNTEGKAAKTLFATHYHELVELQKQCARVKNFNVEVKKTRGKIVFLHKLVEGGCDHSYGIEVARLAGLPERVIERANVVLKNLEAQELSARDGGGVGTTKILPSPTQMSLLTILPDHPVIDQLRNTDLDSMSPMDLMILVSRWQSEVNGESEG